MGKKIYNSQTIKAIKCRRSQNESKKKNGIKKNKNELISQKRCLFLN